MPRRRIWEHSSGTGPSRQPDHTFVRQKAPYSNNCLISIARHNKDLKPYFEKRFFGSLYSYFYLLTLISINYFYVSFFVSKIAPHFSKLLRYKTICYCFSLHCSKIWYAVVSSQNNLKFTILYHLVDPISKGAVRVALLTVNLLWMLLFYRTHTDWKNLS